MAYVVMAHVFMADVDVLETYRLNRLKPVAAYVLRHVVDMRRTCGAAGRVDSRFVALIERSIVQIVVMGYIVGAYIVMGYIVMA